jgi:hypothetical protein
MSDILTGAFVLLFFVLLSLRPLTSDARTATDYRERARRAGWAGCLLGALRVALVASLLVLNDACRMIPPAIAFVRVVLGAITSALLQTGRIPVGDTA